MNGDPVYTAAMAQRERYVIPLLLLALAVAYAAPIFSPLKAVHSGDMLKDFDWLKIAAFERFARQSLLRGGLALWCPYFGGGYPLIAHPEDGSLSPLILPSYLFGEAIGMKIQLVLALWLGAWGAYLLARGLLRYGPVGGLTAGIGLMFAGWLAWRVHYGWPMHFGYYLFPLAFYFTWRSIAEARWLAAAALVMTVILQQIAQGLPFFFLFLLGWAVVADLGQIRREKPGRRTLSVIALGVLTALFGAIKIAGLLTLLQANPRSVPYADYLPRDHFYAGLAEWARYLVGEADVYYKNIGLGWWLTGLAAAGLALAWKRIWTLLPVALLFVWIGLGQNAPVDLFRQLHRLPVFGSMHWPLKYVNFFVALVVVLAAGGAADFAADRFGPKRRRWVLAAALLPLAPLVWSHLDLLDRSFTQPAPAPVAATSFRQVAAYPGAPRGALRPAAANMYWLLRQGEGTIDWDGDILLPENAVPAWRIQPDGSRQPVAEYRGEAYLTGGGRLDACEIGVNRLAAVGRAEEAGLVVFNQNAAPGWRVTGGKVRVYQGLLAAPVEEGRFSVELTYRPRWFFIGLGITLLSFFAAGLWLLRRGMESR